MADFALALTQLKAEGAIVQGFSCGETYASIKIFDPGVTFTLQQLSDALNRWHTANDYKINRIKAYPSIMDQLDMIYQDKINNTTTWVDTITAIKSQYSKPA